MQLQISLLAPCLWSLLLTCALSSPTPIVRPRAVRVRQESPAPQSTACGDIIDSINDGYAYFAAVDAYACLTTVPFNAAVAVRFIDYVNTTLQFQSTLAFLKSPPPEYQQPAVDVLAKLQNIKTNATTGVYQNQYQFEIDLQHLLYSTHDAHLYLTAGVTAAFSFLSPISITAASSNGKQIPQAYLTYDIKQARNQSWTPSPVKTINGEDAVEYLTRIASLNSFGGLEAHTDWNQLFAGPTLSIKGDNSVLDGYVNFYPGDDFTLVLENGTEFDEYWLALYNEPYQTGPLTTGGDFYNYFVMGLLPASFNISASEYNPAYTSDESAPSNDTAPAVNSWREISEGAYPDPDIAQDGLAVVTDGVVSGYYLPDVNAAVLSLPTFGQTGYSIGNFSIAVSYFIGNVTATNLTRVVIDLQQNEGGIVELAFSTFKRFFPDVDPFAGSRRRNHELGNTLGEAYTTYFEGLTPGEADYTDFVADEWVITPRLNAATGQNFTSWAEYHGPVIEKGDSFSLTERYNLSSKYFDAALFEGWIPWGYTEGQADGVARPFDAENIVLLTDGLCSSACALLVEMFTQVGVKTIVAGGAPSTGPMQAVGGNRGAALFSGDALDYYILTLNATEVNNTVLSTVPQLNDDGYRDPGVFTNFLGVNLRDQVRPNDTVPLQFKYEAADCRIFYTLDNAWNMSRLWRDAVAASFDDNSLCVEGSTGFTNSSKPAPKPLATEAATLNFDFVEPDAVLTDPEFDLSGGTAADGQVATSGRITLCSATGGCRDAGSTCRTVVLSSCKSPNVHDYFERCVPEKKGQDFCPDSTTWVKETSHYLKVAKTTSNKVLSSNPGVTWTGPCMPNADKYCV